MDTQDPAVNGTGNQIHHSHLGRIEVQPNAVRRDFQRPNVIVEDYEIDGEFKNAKVACSLRQFCCRKIQL
jgi:hypothetical protein